MERLRQQVFVSFQFRILCSNIQLDPDTDRQLEKFREAQSAVRINKEKLDKLKVDTLQKVVFKR